MNKKRVSIMILIIFSVVSIVYIISSSKPETGEVTSQFKSSSLQQVYKGEYNVSFSVTKDSFKFPKKIPGLKIVKGDNISQEQSQEIAQKLGFINEPTILDDKIDGKCYFWKDNNKTLFIFENNAKIKYSTGSFSKSVNKNLGDKELALLASDFLISNNIKETSSFKIGPIKYLKEVAGGEGFQETNRDSATLFQISVLPNSSDYQFVSVSSVQPSSYLEMYQDGSIYSFQTFSIKTEISSYEYELMNYDELVSSSNKAVLIELAGETQLLSDLSDKTLQSVNISKIELGYLIDSDLNSLQPIYILTGEANVLGAKHDYTATLYLLAKKDN